MHDALFDLWKGGRKAFFYASNFGAYFLPDAWWREKAARKLSALTPEEKELADARAAYYNRLPAECPAYRTGTAHGTRIGDFRYPFGARQKHSAYFFDLYRTARCFPPGYRMDYLFGDVTEEPACPAFVKSRPVKAGNSNAVLLKLNQTRHFLFWKDRLNFREKKSMLVGRNVVRQPHRRRFLEMYAGHPLCDIGQVNTDTNREHPEWVKAYLPVPRQLDYKFVCCIEGNDVATNLKWVMASNSLAVMPRPRFETWFMEGTLVPDYHYIEIKDDYSDLPEKLAYYMRHPEEAEQIIAHAHEHVDQFRNRRMEQAVALRVMEMYFQRTGQTGEKTSK